MPSGSGPTSPTPTTNGTNRIMDRKQSTDGPSLIRTISTTTTTTATTISTASHDPTEYVQRARVTKAAPPKPAYNPMQFVQIKPCNLYQVAQHQLKRAEEVKKVKEIKKEDAEDWQGNLDSWKSSRRKRVEHIIDRVVEVKKLELEEHDRTRRKSKTFSEMLEERGTRRKMSLAVYAEDDTNDLSDLGIGTSSASGKSSLSEDFDNHSVISDNQDIEKSHSDLDNNSNHENGNRDYVSSPGYDTSSSTAPASSPDPCEFTYEGAIQDYKSRISRTQAGFNGFNHNGHFSKDSTPELDSGRGSANDNNSSPFTPKRPAVTKIEDRLINFELKSSNLENGNETSVKKDLPKVNILRRRELFEKDKLVTNGDAGKSQNRLSGDFSNSKSIKERLSSLEKQKEELKKEAAANKKANRLSGDITSIKERLTSLEKQNVGNEKVPKVDVPIVSLKDRLSSLQSAVAASAAKEDDKVSENVVINQEIKREEIQMNDAIVVGVERKFELNQPILLLHQHTEVLMVDELEIDREDSGIHTADVSCSVSQADEQADEEHANDLISIEQKVKLLEITTDVSNDPNSSGEIIEQHIEEYRLEKKQSIPDLIPIAAEQPVLTDVATNELLDDICSSSELTEQDTSVLEALDIAFQAIDGVNQSSPDDNESDIEKLINELIQPISSVHQPHHSDVTKVISNKKIQRNSMDAAPERSIPQAQPLLTEPIYEIIGNDVDDNGDDNIKREPAVVVIQQTTSVTMEIEEEPYYQVPKSSEPYYEVPKSKPIPLYENVDMFFNGTNKSFPMLSPEEVPFPIGSALEPPKEKPPPPPVEDATDDEGGNEDYEDNVKPEDAMKRMNSTRRIKKEIRNKRSSFLGIEGSVEDDVCLELSVAPPPDMSALLQEERRLEKQLYMKTGLYENSDTGDSRDSGLSENHSRQSSELFTTSSEEQDDYIAKKENEIIKVLEEEERRRSSESSSLQKNDRNGIVVVDEEWTCGNTTNGLAETETKVPSNRQDDEARMRCLEDQIREQEEVLRVERELLQLEQEELKRQRENLLLRENLARKELDHGAKMLMSANHRSLQDINASSIGHYANVPNPYPVYPVHTPPDYRQSMPDLQHIHLDVQSFQRKIPPTPPAKPIRSHFHQEYQTARESSIKASRAPSADASLEIIHARHQSMPARHSVATDEYVQLRHHHHPSSTAVHAVTNIQYGNMTRHTLHALSAVPKPKLTDGWVQQNLQNRKSEPAMDKYFPIQRKNDFVINNENYLRKSSSKERVSDSWVARKSEPRGFNYGKHWLIQEAEQRRIDQQRGVRLSSNQTAQLQNGWNGGQHGMVQRKSSGGDNKPLPDSVIQTLTQRVQNRIAVNSERRRFDANPVIGGASESAVPQSNLSPESQDKILSVSGKKKCSHCAEELGRGAAMIIESLRLFYHIDCFKCCVCRVQLGDGLNGTDVRVRNQKLHCHNCYSSDDGVKFSCV